MLILSPIPDDLSITPAIRLPVLSDVSTLQWRQISYEPVYRLRHPNIILIAAVAVYPRGNINLWPVGWSNCWPVVARARYATVICPKDCMSLMQIIHQCYYYCFLVWDFIWLCGMAIEAVKEVMKRRRWSTDQIIPAPILFGISAGFSDFDPLPCSTVIWMNCGSWFSVQRSVWRGTSEWVTDASKAVWQ